MEINPQLLLRCDAGPTIGTGHVMRCLALAGALRSQYEARATFLVAQISEALATRIRQAGHQVRTIQATPGSRDDAEACLKATRELDAGALVLDGYHFESKFQAHLDDASFTLLYFDDRAHLDHYHADLVVNQNLHADAGDYPSTGPTTKLLLGPGYAVLRPEFNAYRDWERTHPKTASNLLITLGGADPQDATSTVLEALHPLTGGDLDIRVIVGAANPHLEHIHGLARDQDDRVQVVRDAPTMAEHMAWAEMAVCAGGSTVWELAYMQVPMVVTVLAENQVRIAQSLEKAGIARSLGRATAIQGARVQETVQALRDDPHLRSSMGASGRTIVDGGGAERITHALGGVT